VGLLEVARLGKPHGLRGEISAQLFGVNLAELEELKRLVLRLESGEDRPVCVIGGRPKGKGLILALDLLPDRTAAEGARGAVLLSPREDLPKPEEGEWFVTDLVGLSVADEEGSEIGTLEEVLTLPANDVLVVRGKLGEVLLPAIPEVIRKVNLDERKMTVHILPGLVDVPAEKGAS
jgi:16S rRNA processing protein RimM